MAEQITRLTKSDLTAIENRLQSELADIGAYPTIENLRAEGYTENTWINATLDNISGAGRIMTLLIAEFLQAFGAIILGVVLVVLEADRIKAGSEALGLTTDKALLVAIAFTSLNAIMPIYRLRGLRGQSTLTETRHTARGALESFGRRLFGIPQAYDRDVNHNPTLAIAEAAITWGTLFLAFYAVLGGIISQYAAQRWYSALGAIVTQTSIGDLLKILSGLLIAIGGVFGVQSISHEIGVRILTDQPERLSDILEVKKTEYNRRAHELREQITAEYMAGKIADQRRKEQTTSTGNGHRESLRDTVETFSANGGKPSQNGHTFR